MNRNAHPNGHIDKSLAYALLGAVMSTGALVALSGPVGISFALAGCVLCVYSLRAAQRSSR
jgi:hypothetical protein